MTYAQHTSSRPRAQSPRDHDPPGSPGDLPAPGKDQGHDEISPGAAGLSTKDPYGGACAWVAGMVLTLLEASGFWRLRSPRQAQYRCTAPIRTCIRQPWYDSFRFIPFTLLSPQRRNRAPGPGRGGPRSAAPVCRIRTARFWRFRVYPGAVRRRDGRSCPVSVGRVASRCTDTRDNGRAACSSIPYTYAVRLPTRLYLSLNRYSTCAGPL